MSKWPLSLIADEGYQDLRYEESALQALLSTIDRSKKEEPI
jgi:hypothetical protein